MCEQTMPYSVGTLLWFKTPIHIWWPAKVVDASTMPEDLHEYRDRMKKLTLAVVYFVTENKYELVTNMEKVCLYSSPKKMDFIEKGYSTYLKQKKGDKHKFNMEYFIEDVKHFERQIGGNENIFVEVEKNMTHQKNDSTKLNQLINDLFKTSKQTKKGVRKSLTTTKTTKPKLKSDNISKSFSCCPPVTKQTAPRTSRKKTESPINTTRNKTYNPPNNTTYASNKNLNPANSVKNKTCNTLPAPKMKNRNLLQESKGNFVCFNEACNFSATKFYMLKRHLDTCRLGQSSHDVIQKHKNKNLENESKKRKKVRNGRKEGKKLKTDVDNIIEDWSDHSDNVKPGNEDIKTLSEEKDTLNEIFDFDENESEKVFDRLRRNNSHSNHVDEDKSREIDESKEFIKKDPEYVNEIVSFSDNPSVLNSSDGNAVKKDITVADQSIQFSKESVNLNENHIKTENVESCIKSSTSTETKYNPSTVITKNLEVQNDKKANRLVNTDGVECMFGKTIPTNEWVKHNSWTAFTDNGMDEARKYASMIMNMSIMSLEPHDLKPVLEKEPPFKAPIFCGAPHDENPVSFKIIKAPKVPPKYTDEELVNLPEFKIARELLNSGQHDSVTVTIKGAQIIHNPLDAFN